MSIQSHEWRHNPSTSPNGRPSSSESNKHAASATLFVMSGSLKPLATIKLRS
uniref:Uncharacterized protein n=1 Tax=Solanum tuberosum TaxID=4113 RepID=M1D3Z2_SOLTU